MAGKSFSGQTNREQRQQPRGRSFFCGNCDRDHTWAGQKCSTCGVKRKHKNRLKPVPSNTTPGA